MNTPKILQTGIEDYFQSVRSLVKPIQGENAKRMLLVSFVAGLTRGPCREVRYTNPQIMEQALIIAISVQEVEKQERFNESFYTKFYNSVRLLS
jgi:hypothetical protein